MRIAITGGTGFVGRTLARSLIEAGHEVVLISRGIDRRHLTALKLPGVAFHPIGLGDAAALARAFADCEGVAHCAGINREIGAQTYQRVHVEGTRHVVHAAEHAGVKKVALLSFLRARPDCGSGYHTSKWAAEEIVRQSSLDYTIFKAGVIYGQGDHMLDHLSHAFHTFPVFAFVGFRDQRLRPLAVEDMAALLKAALADGALSRQTVAVTGPEELTLRDAVRRVARVVGRKPLMFPMPLWFHYALGWCAERLMVVPVVSVAQVRILSEGLVDPSPPFDPLPPELAPQIHFTPEQIRRGLPPAARFGLRDLRCCPAMGNRQRRHCAFFEMP